MKRPKVRAKSSQAHLGNYHTPESRRRISASHKRRVALGLNNFYVDGRTAETTKQRNSGDYALWRDEVFKRDDYTCQECEVRGGYLEAHHILSWSKYPMFRFMLGNGLTLCGKCHEQTPSYRKKAGVTYQLITL